MAGLRPPICVSIHFGGLKRLPLRALRIFIRADRTPPVILKRRTPAHWPTPHVPFMRRHESNVQLGPCQRQRGALILIIPKRSHKRFVAPSVDELIIELYEALPGRKSREEIKEPQAAKEPTRQAATCKGNALDIGTPRSPPPISAPFRSNLL